MSLRSLESAITYEAREVLDNRSLRVKDLREWRAAEIKPQDGEIVIYLPLNRVFVAVFKHMDKRNRKEGKP